MAVNLTISPNPLVQPETLVDIVCTGLPRGVRVNLWIDGFAVSNKTKVARDGSVEFSEDVLKLGTRTVRIIRTLDGTVLAEGSLQVVEKPIVIPPPPGNPWSTPFMNRPNQAQITIGSGTDVVIEGKSFLNTPWHMAAIKLANVKGGVIRANDFKNIPGAIYLYRCENITIEWNRYENITGPYTDVHSNVRNFVQTNESRNIIIQDNKGKGGDTEDVVSIFSSSFCKVLRNHFEGTNWQSGSGSGIALGDYGGTDNVAEGNKLLNIGQVGAFIAGGHRHKIMNNIIKGERRAKSNVGIYVWENPQRGNCSGHTVSGNRVDWVREDGVFNPYWNAGNCGGVTEGGNVFGAIDINTMRVTL